jgi:hypothetical protein
MAVGARLSHFRSVLSAGAGMAAFALLAAPAAAPAPAASAAAPSAGARLVTIGGPAAVQPIAPGFLGLSLEYFAVPSYAGEDPHAIDPVFIQLVRNLTGDAPPVLRIGGETTDNTWWPAPRVSRPAGGTFPLTPGWIAIARAMSAQLNARLILGINLEADSTALAAAEAKALISGIGRHRIQALELGNEPELYGAFTWGLTGALGRPKGWDFADFDRDFSRIARALPHLPLAGPTDGVPTWYRYLGRFLSDQPRVAVATLHRYPLQRCFASPKQAIYPTIAHLLAPSSSRSLAESVATAAKTAHAHHASLRIDEMNSVSCGDGQVPDVTRSFASALWVIDAMFEMARVGVDGVNIHTYPGATYELFHFRRVGGRWRATVAPDYYGVELFAQAAPPRSRLLTVSPTGASHLKVWATRAPDGTIRVVAINDGAGSQDLALRVAGASGTGGLERLRAPGLLARRGVTLGGQGFAGATTTGLPAGRSRVFTVAQTHGDYRFRVPMASAALLTVTGH